MRLSDDATAPATVAAGLLVDELRDEDGDARLRDALLAMIDAERAADYDLRAPIDLQVLARRAHRRRLGIPPQRARPPPDRAPPACRGGLGVWEPPGARGRRRYRMPVGHRLHPGPAGGRRDRVLERLAAAGAELRYHGDFDWPGPTIANLLVGGYGCSPWCFSGGDYLDVLARLAPVVAELPLLGDGWGEARWDPSLTAEMGRADRAVHEELVLDDLLLDLSPG